MFHRPPWFLLLIAKILTACGQTPNHHRNCHDPNRHARRGGAHPPPLGVQMDDAINFTVAR